MAASIFKAGSKNRNSAESSHSRPPTICAPSSIMQRNLNLGRFNVLEEDQPGPIFKVGSKNPDSAEPSHSRPRTIRAPSSRMQRNLNLSRFNVLEEDQPAPLKIVGSDPSSHSSLSLLEKRSLASTSRPKRCEHKESLSLTVVPKKPRTQRVSFNIVYKGLCIDNELSDDMRSRYYRLCSQKKQLLHDGLPEGLDTNLVVGMIDQTVSIAAKIKNTKPNSTKEELENWDSILEAFELLGMKVAFLRDRIHVLATFLFESEAAPDIQSCAKLKCEIERVEKERPKLQEKFQTMKETAEKCKKVLDSLRRKVQPYESIFKEVVAVPW